ncbi:unnamed protein product [Periconia digitata]|uniref:Cutinase n=1 Tax=Periconia digitata TaxID=1303443 RepID=A0A9W4UCT3_9PLEO|nr:unnamed protein product [Periconia digitata]
MSFTRRSALLAVLPALAAAQGGTPKLDAACEDVVLFWARGNDAPYHDGRTSPLIDATCAKLAAQGTSCDYIDVQFDATYGGPFCDQIAEGARNGVAQVTAFNSKCPNTKIVMNGYSQGAQVTGDILGGPGGCEKVSDGLDSNSAAGKAIAAALLWGDVRHTANQPYNVLDGAGSEVYPRTGNDLALINRYSSVLRSYCAAGDPVCAGGDVVADHLNYFELYTNDAAAWIVSMVNKVLPTSSSAPSSSASSTMVTSSSRSSAPVVTASSSSAVVPSSGASSSAVAPSSGASSSAVAPSSGASSSAVAPSSGASSSAVVPSSGSSAVVPSNGASGSVSVPTASSNGTGSYSAIDSSVPHYTATVPQPSGTTPSASVPSTNTHPGTHPPFPAATPYDNCVVKYEVVTKYV